MNRDEVGTSPFAASEDSASEPRLGILHLLVLTACVAAYLGFVQTLLRATQAETSQQFIPASVLVLSTIQPIGSGAALAGILLLVARRLRGLRFPSRPGEYLLMIAGANVIVDMLYRLFYSVLSGSEQISWRSSWVSGLPALGIIATVFIWAFIGVKSRRWRIYLLTTIMLLFLPVWFVSFRGPQFLFSFLVCRALLLLLVLGIVLLKDHRDGKRYPWTHWFGVAVTVWMEVGMAVIYSWQLATHEWV